MFVKDEFNCTCEAGYQGEVYHCPFHEAAPDMYGACLTALGVMATLDQSKGWVKEISSVIEKAISKAEGKDERTD